MAEAYKWRLMAAMAAMAGDSDGMWLVGVTLEDREEEFEEAMRWFEKAAMPGHPRSAGKVGERAKSTGEYAESYFWYSIGAASARNHYMSDLGYYYEGLLNELTAELTPEELAQAQQRASDLYEQIIGK